VGDQDCPGRTVGRELLALGQEENFVGGAFLAPTKKSSPPGTSNTSPSPVPQGVNKINLLTVFEILNFDYIPE